MISIYNLNRDVLLSSGVASSISEGNIFIYSCSAQLISFEIKSISKEVNCAEHGATAVEHNLKSVVKS